MTLSIDAVAAALLQARAQGDLAPVVAHANHLRDVADAYAVQEQVARALHWHQGGAARHWKSGGPSRDVTLTHAALPPAGVVNSPANVSTWPWHVRGVEAEIALRLGRDVTPAMAVEADMVSAQSWIEAMTVALEIIDCRWDQGLATPAVLKLADLQAHGGLVLGQWLEWREIDWPAQALDLRVNGALVLQRVGTHPLGHPAWGLAAFLRHATRLGQTLAAGCVVTTGSWNGILEVAAGDAVQADFAGLAQVEVQF